MNKYIKLLVESFFDDMFTEKNIQQDDNSILPEIDIEDTQYEQMKKLLCTNDNIDYCQDKEDFINYMINICNIENILKYIYHNTNNDRVNILQLVEDLTFPKNDITYEKYNMNQMYDSKHSKYCDSFKMYHKKYNTLIGNVNIRGGLSVLIQIDMSRLGMVYLDCTIPVNNISEREYIRKNVDTLKNTLYNNQCAYKIFFNKFDEFYKLLHKENKNTLKIEEKHIETIKNLIEKRKNKYQFNWRADVIDFSDLYDEINNQTEFIPYLVAYMVIYKQYCIKDYYQEHPINITYDDIMSIILVHMLDIRITKDGSLKRTIQKYKDIDISLLINTYNKYYNDPRLLNATQEILG